MTIASIHPCFKNFKHFLFCDKGCFFNYFSELCVESSSHEVFLLGSAALANITFMDSLACDYLLQYNTAALLIEACHLDKANSLFAKDQVSLFQYFCAKQNYNHWRIQGAHPARPPRVPILSL